ncbi:MAG TPA: type II toxin-antitoxin system prevent-host-death family antitoxin, partial [Candidatus Elarobacter sp.]|nr:type II toxin-antitoxin system prevent-host-death family antitoxin [Candidatus Elarobacter sp.]
SEGSDAGRMVASRVREEFSDTIDRVAFQGERVIIQRHGKDEAALISIADLALLEALEDQADVAAARAALAESPKRRDYAAVRKELGLTR